MPAAQAQGLADDRVGEIAARILDEAVRQIRRSGEAIEQPGEGDRRRLLRRHQQRHQLLDDPPGPQLAVDHATEDVDLVRGIGSARFHRARERRRDGCLALLEQRGAQFAHQPVAFAGQGHGWVAGRSQHAADCRDQLGGDPLIADAQHEANEDLVAERPHRRRRKSAAPSAGGSGRRRRSAPGRGAGM
jgi:hypothetical protein